MKVGKGKISVSKRRSIFIPQMDTINICRNFSGLKHEGSFEDIGTDVSVLQEPVLPLATIKVEESISSVEVENVKINQRVELS